MPAFPGLGSREIQMQIQLDKRIKIPDLSGTGTMCEDCGIDNIRTEQSREDGYRAPLHAGLMRTYRSTCCVLSVETGALTQTLLRACAIAASGQRPTSEDSLS